MHITRFVLFMFIGVSLVVARPYIDDIGILSCLGKACINDVIDVAPVCAIDSSGVSRTFDNMCQLEMTECRQNTLYAVVREGEC